ncbi:MAG: hypothetical protein U0350_25440 [Caldilineaceae bacterium]
MYEPTLTQPSMSATPPPSAPRNRRQRVRSFFWPGFAGAFLLLSLLSCGGLAMTLGLNKINLSELQSSGPVWTPPAITPAPVAAPAASSSNNNANPGGGAFQVGDVVRNITNSRVNVRATPGYQNKGNGDILAQLAPNDTMSIIGDRVIADNLTWWQVNYKGVQGWVAEVTASGVQILAK